MVAALAGTVVGEEEAEMTVMMIHLRHTHLVHQSRNQSTAQTVNSPLTKALSHGGLASGPVLLQVLPQAMLQMPGKIGTTEVGEHTKASSIRTRK